TTEERVCRPAEHRNALRRRHYGGVVPAWVRRSHAVDSSGHRGLRLERRQQELSRQGSDGGGVADIFPSGNRLEVNPAPLEYTVQAVVTAARSPTFHSIDRENKEE